MLRNSDTIIHVNQVNVGFARANNQALPLATGRYVLLLNIDAFVSPDTLSKTVAYIDAHPHCGILGVTLVGRDEMLQPSARYFPDTVKSLSGVYRTKPDIHEHLRG